MDIFTMLKTDEGLKLEIYKDNLGFFTIGIGHLLTKSDSIQTAISNLDVSLGRSTNGIITQDEAQTLFQSDVQTAKTSLSQVGLGTLLNSLDPIRQAALINMSFQLGARGVANFKKSISYLQNQQWSSAALELKNSSWYNQTPSRAARVINTFLTGTWAAYQ